ncbi:hypothetical protein SAMN05421840_1065 [Shewanella morhuae]|nr:hypothetical protein SAMN05421840_1065 [Shewanella morhuae]
MFQAFFFYWCDWSILKVMLVTMTIVAPRYDNSHACLGMIIVMHDSAANINRTAKKQYG